MVDQPEDSTARILVFHRDALFVDAMQAALDPEDVQVVPADSIDEVYAASGDVDSCLIDVRLDGALDALRKLSATEPGLRVLGFADSDDRRQIAAVVRTGAAGWVTTADGLDRLLHVVRREKTDSRTRRAAARQMMARAARRPRQPQLLTARETEVLAGLADGASTKALAARLNVSAATARTHVHNVLGKLGVHTRLEAVAYAVEHQLIEVNDATDDEDDDDGRSTVAR